MKRTTFPRLADVLFLALAFFCMCRPTGALAQDYERYKPKTPPPSTNVPRIPAQSDKEVVGSDQVLVERLDAIIVLDQADKVVLDDPFSAVEGISYNVTDSRSLMHSPQARGILESYLGQPITLRRLNQLSRDLIQYYRKQGYPIVDVLIPEQNITEGTVQLVVIESHVGQLKVRGASCTDPCWLLGQVRCTTPGGRIRESALKEDLYWLNRSPFRRVGVDFAPGKLNGTTDVLFNVNEVTPIRSYVGYEDTGVRSLALERLLAGVIIGNVFGRDGTLAYQYTSDPKFTQLQAHSGSFSYDFDRELSLINYGSWSGVRPDLPPPFNQNGESWQVGSVLNRYLVRTSRHEESLSAGVDFKSTNNSLEFGGTNVQNSASELLELNLGYDYLHRYGSYDYARSINDLYIGPGDGFSPRNTSAAFNSIRANTQPTFWYYRGVLERQWTNELCHELRLRGTGQATSKRLLFSEMLGFGGNDTIRGYDTRMISGDCGWITNAEYGPQARRVDWFQQPGSIKSFVFFDMGQAFTIQPVSGEFNNRLIAGTGVGVRYNLSNRLAFKCDYGHALQNVAGMATNDRLHISLVSFFGPTPR